MALLQLNKVLLRRIARSPSAVHARTHLLHTHTWHGWVPLRCFAGVLDELWCTCVSVCVYTPHISSEFLLCDIYISKREFFLLWNFAVMCCQFSSFSLPLCAHCTNTWPTQSRIKLMRSTGPTVFLVGTVSMCASFNHEGGAEEVSGHKTAALIQLKTQYWRNSQCCNIRNQDKKNHKYFFLHSYIVLCSHKISDTQNTKKCMFSYI